MNRRGSGCVHSGADRESVPPFAGEHGFTILFIAHDLAMVEFLCDRVGVMNHGQLVEVGTTEDIFLSSDRILIRKKLLKAVPMLPGSRKRYGGSEEHRENG